MKLFIKKSAPKKTPFIAINKSALKQVKGGTRREAQSEDAEID